jgi:hypothetical protein
MGRFISFYDNLSLTADDAEGLCGPLKPTPLFQSMLRSSGECHRRLVLNQTTTIPLSRIQARDHIGTRPEMQNLGPAILLLRKVYRWICIYMHLMVKPAIPIIRETVHLTQDEMKLLTDAVNVGIADNAMEAIHIAIDLLHPHVVAKMKKQQT